MSKNIWKYISYFCNGACAMGLLLLALVLLVNNNTDVKLVISDGCLNFFIIVSLVSLFYQLVLNKE